MQAGRQASRQAGRQASPINPAFVRNWVGLVSALKHDIYILHSCRFSIVNPDFAFYRSPRKMPAGPVMAALPK